MQEIAQQRCFNHILREAAANCPECSRFFCRECVTEHEDRVLCAVCLARESKKVGLKRVRMEKLQHILQLAGGGLTVWIIFYYLGQMLLALPTSFHDGTIWKTG